MEVTVIRKIRYSLDVEPVYNEYGRDVDATEVKASELYEKLEESGELSEYYDDEDFEYEIY